MRLKWFGHVLWMKVNTRTKSVHPTGKDQEDDRRKDGWTVLKRTRTMTIRCNKVWKTAGRQ